MYYISCSQGPDHPWSQSKNITPDGKFPFIHPYSSADWELWKNELFRSYSTMDESDMPLPPYWRAYLFVPKTLEILNLMMFTGARTLWTKQDNGEWKKELLAL